MQVCSETITRQYKQAKSTTIARGCLGHRAFTTYDKWILRARDRHDDIRTVNLHILVKSPDGGCNCILF